MPTAYCAAPGRVDPLRRELAAHGPVHEVAERILLQDAPPRPCVWAVDVWFAVEDLPIASIGDAARQLRARQPFWRPLERAAPRRTRLIADKLGVRSIPLLAPPDAGKLRPSGVFTLLGRDRMLCARRHARPFPGGAPPLAEDHRHPPSRAYRKLWEALLLLDDHPRPGERVYDLGASPGSWTWALARYGCEVIAIDKAPLAPALAALDNVHTQQGSAFALDARHHHADWICSDIACYPRRLYTFARRWLDLGDCRRFILTIKLQGADDRDVIRAFQDLGPGVTVHLWHNKHELTWIGHPALGHDSIPRPWPWTAREA